ncbi:hypothetical protein [Novacetimonas hansenii]|uniref:hypothetical protein n=1 Tax=Novacetimonas hansenii TaxID=436 RepID=UPI0023DD35DA|nr:hypothetical protein [Novacetimonas hansenii]WEQ60567.1 hypothetical protein LV563_14685 [Novacetimonas hansenii]
MADDFPRVGQVIDYHYLWKWQDLRGETEGRKSGRAVSSSSPLTGTASITSSSCQSRAKSLPLIVRPC